MAPPIPPGGRSLCHPGTVRSPREAPSPRFMDWDGHNGVPPWIGTLPPDGVCLGVDQAVEGTVPTV